MDDLVSTIHPADAHDVTDLPGRVEHLLHYVYDQCGGDMIDRPLSSTQSPSPSSEVPDSEDIDAELRYLTNDAASPSASLGSFELQLRHGQTPLGHPRDQLLTTSRGSTPSGSPVAPREAPLPQSYRNKSPSPIGKAVISVPSAKIVGDTKESPSKSDEKRFFHKVSTSLSVDVVVHIASKESSDVEDSTNVDPVSSLTGHNLGGRSPKRLTNIKLDVEKSFEERLPLSSKPPISPRPSRIHKKETSEKKRSRSEHRQKMTRRSSVSPKRAPQGKNKKSEHKDFGDTSWEHVGARSEANSPVDTDCPSPPYPPPPRPFLPSREGSTTVELAKSRHRARVQKLKLRYSTVGNISEIDDSDKPMDLPVFTPRHSPELTPRTASPDLEASTEDKKKDSKQQNTPGGDDDVENDDNLTPMEEAPNDMEEDGDVEGL
ncbi:uncharacterized protein [Branchiostoma lanceolatum]|uniref:uncharacterized protein n=1 Tax=Branchiostoma lanceolatum TaxID=7740 RepID=UPI00345443B8